jgi:hypothetical protein
MHKWLKINALIVSVAIAMLLGLHPSAYGQGKHHVHKNRKKADTGDAVLWRPVDVGRQDLFLGPGGREMQPDLRNITFEKEEKGGYSRKYTIRDGSGRKWVAKIGNEAQSETSAVRLLSSIGYITEVNYLAPKLTIPGRGTFTNVRLEARPEGIKRGKTWSWGKTPFEHTPQMNGLKLMMAFFGNWDTKSANNVILHDGRERQYVISDLGVSFGKTGSNGLPLFWRIGRSRNDPTGYARAKFITGVHRDGRLKVHFNGKNGGMMRTLTVNDARWLGGLLSQLSDKQIRDAFIAANYSERDVNILTGAVKDRISQLVRVSDAAPIARTR